MKKLPVLVVGVCCVLMLGGCTSDFDEESYLSGLKNEIDFLEIDPPEDSTISSGQAFSYKVGYSFDSFDPTEEYEIAVLLSWSVDSKSSFFGIWTQDLIAAGADVLTLSGDIHVTDDAKIYPYEVRVRISRILDTNATWSLVDSETIGYR